MEKNNYKTREISLLDKPEVPKDCTITLVAGPRFDYVQPIVDALKKYQETGGRLLLFLVLALFVVDRAWSGRKWLSRGRHKPG